jgi:hypothetical protein
MEIVKLAIALVPVSLLLCGSVGSRVRRRQTAAHKNRHRYDPAFSTALSHSRRLAGRQGRHLHITVSKMSDQRASVPQSLASAGLTFWESQTLMRNAFRSAAQPHPGGHCQRRLLG